MTPRVLPALAALTLLSACLAAEHPLDDTPSLSTMSEASAPLVAGPGGRFLWTCSAPEIGAGWRFGVVEQPNETGSEVVLASAGSLAAIPLDRRDEDGLERYVAGPNQIDIAPDGSARLNWAGATYEGQCQAGAPL